jgi:hypothetical protein
MSEVLTQKTKTTLDILNENCKGEQILKGGNRLDEQWVPLVDAQKEISKYKTMGAKDCFRANLLQAKVEAANKIIDAFWAEYLSGSYDEVKLIECLRVCLK